MSSQKVKFQGEKSHLQIINDGTSSLGNLSEFAISSFEIKSLERSIG